MKILNSQSGGAFLKLIIASLVMMAMAYFAASKVSHQGQSSKMRRLNAAHQVLVDQLRMQLNDSLSCSPALKNQSLNLSIGSKSQVSLNLGFGQHGGPIRAGWESKADGLSVKSVTLVVEREATSVNLNNEVAPRTIIYDWPRISMPVANSFQKFYADLLIEPGAGHWNPNDPEHIIRLAIVVDPATGRIHQCHGIVSLAEACESMGGAYDVSENSLPAERCNPDLTCFNNRFGLVNSSSACPYPYIANSVGHVDGQLKYLCTWCNRNR